MGGTLNKRMTNGRDESPTREINKEVRRAVRKWLFLMKRFEIRRKVLPT